LRSNGTGENLQIEDLKRFAATLVKLCSDRGIDITGADGADEGGEAMDALRRILG